MEKFKYVVPSKEYESQAIDYINEHRKYKSNINGSSGLHRYVDNNDYDGWLKKIDDDLKCVPTEDKVPSEAYFLIRVDDNKIVGMINIRPILNERLRELGGNIGYGIRPLERGKGYNKINLYLGLLRCKELGLREVMLDCDKDNLASSSTMKALGGVKVREHYDDTLFNCVIEDYIIDVDKAVDEYKEIYDRYIYHDNVKGIH